MTYRLHGRAVLDAWLDTDPPEREVVLHWLFRLIEDPDSVDATPVPVLMGLPLHTAIVPDTWVAVTFCVLKHPRPRGSRRPPATHRTHRLSL